jgi:hypothetical protein
MGKTASEKRSARTKPSGAANGADVSTPGAGARASAAGDPAEPIERARLQAEVARQRVRIAKEELKRARKRMKEAKREAKRARKQAAVARKAWKKARKAHRASAPQPSAVKGKRHPPTPKGPARAGKRKSTRRRAGVPARKSQAPKTEASQSQSDGSTPAIPSTET